MELKPTSQGAQSATRRILRDIKENMASPVPNVSICMPDESDIFTHHVTIKILNGIYKDIILHLILHIPKDYPLTGPAMNIAPGFAFGHKFHEHVYDDRHHGNTICNDLLTNFASFFADKKEAASGWSPGCTINTILMQMSIFFEDPDLPEKCLPSSLEIERLRQTLQKFECTCGHKTVKPFPPLLIDEVKNDEVKIETSDKTPTNSEKMTQQILLEKVTCSVTKENIITNLNLALGCPLNVNIDARGRIWATPLLEIISYDTYAGEIQKAGFNKLDLYQSTFFKSALGQNYNFWMPFYLSKNHYENNHQTIINAISIIKHGSAIGDMKLNFKPTDALDVLLSLCNKTIFSILDGKLHESRAAIETYVQFLRLLMEFIHRYPELQTIINDKISKFKVSLEHRNKSVVPDFGEFIILVFLSKTNYDAIKPFLIQEFFARQIFWLQKDKITYINSADKPIAQCLGDFFNSRKAAFYLFVFNIQMAKTFIQGNGKEKLDETFGFPTEDVMDFFQNYIKKIKTELIAMPQFLKAVGFFNQINTPEKMMNFICEADAISIQQKYTGKNIKPNSNNGQRQFNNNPAMKFKRY